MAGDQPSGVNEGSTTHPHTGQRPPAYPPQPTNHSRTWPALVLAAIATVVAVAALIVALMQPSSSTSSGATTTHTATETAAAQQRLCETYKLAAQAVQVDTNGSDKALARTATTNAAVMLENAAADPAIDAQHHDAAQALATAYLTATAKASNGVVADAEWQAALDDVVAKDAAMKKLCNGG